MIGERRTLVSTDSLGILGTPRLLNELYKFDLAGKIDGLEMIGWAGISGLRLRSLISEAQGYGWKVDGIHGRTGGLHDSFSVRHRLLLLSLNLALTETRPLAKNFADIPYILIHTPVLRSHDNVEALKKYRQGLVFCENHIRITGAGGALEGVIRLRQLGIKAGLMFDLLHYFEADHDSLDFDTKWNNGLLYLEKVILESRDFTGREFPLGIHLSMGRNLSDSFAGRELTVERLKRLAQVINANDRVVYFVIENLDKFPSIIIPFGRFINMQRDWNERNLAKLSVAGLI